ncbi:GNAT family N-acetyltransferase [soil metagenome]
MTGSRRSGEWRGLGTRTRSADRLVVPARGHPLWPLLRDAARGTFPPADADIEICGAPPGPSDAVVAFTAHHLVAGDVPASDVRAHLPSDPLTGPLSAGFLVWLGRALGSEPGSLDVVLAHPGGRSAPAASSGPNAPLLRASTADHPRASRAERYRSDVVVYEEREGRGIVVLGRGLAGRWELSVDVAPAHRGSGIGRALIRAARGLLPAEEPLFAQVAPGNTASLRAFQAAGFVPICAEVLFLRPRLRARPGSPRRRSATPIRPRTRHAAPRR